MLVPERHSDRQPLVVVERLGGVVLYQGVDVGLLDVEGLLGEELVEVVEVLVLQIVVGLRQRQVVGHYPEVVLNFHKERFHSRLVRRHEHELVHDVGALVGSTHPQLGSQPVHDRRVLVGQHGAREGHDHPQAGLLRRVAEGRVDHCGERSGNLKELDHTERDVDLVIVEDRQCPHSDVALTALGRVGQRTPNERGAFGRRLLAVELHRLGKALHKLFPALSDDFRRIEVPAVSDSKFCFLFGHPNPPQKPVDNFILIRFYFFAFPAVQAASAPKPCGPHQH